MSSTSSPRRYLGLNVNSVCKGSYPLLGRINLRTEVSIVGEIQPHHGDTSIHTSQCSIPMCVASLLWDNENLSSFSSAKEDPQISRNNHAVSCTSELWGPRILLWHSSTFRTIRVACNGVILPPRKRLPEKQCDPGLSLPSQFRDWEAAEILSSSFVFRSISKISCMILTL